jgi:hypothetical protein
MWTASCSLAWRAVAPPARTRVDAVDSLATIRDEGLVI